MHLIWFDEFFLPLKVFNPFCVVFLVLDLQLVGSFFASIKLKVEQVLTRASAQLYIWAWSLISGSSLGVHRGENGTLKSFSISRLFFIWFQKWQVWVTIKEKKVKPAKQKNVNSNLSLIHEFVVPALSVDGYPLLKKLKNSSRKDELFVKNQLT